MFLRVVVYRSRHGKEGEGFVNNVQIVHTALTSGKTETIHGCVAPEQHLKKLYHQVYILIFIKSMLNFAEL